MKGDGIPMKLRRFLSAVTALLLVCGMPVSVFAAEYDLAAGSVTVTATADGQTVTHGDNDAVQDNAPVIIQTNNETPTTNTITIKAEGSATANVTIQDVNIVISDPTDAPPVDHSGEAAVTIDVADGAKANVTLDGVNIDVGGTGAAEFRVPGEAAVQITGNGDVTIELDGENTVQSGAIRAGVEKNDGDSSGKLTITDANGTDGSLKATGGYGGSGIGGGTYGSGSHITIEGSAEVTAKGGDSGSGIGGGSLGSGSHITITGSAEVTANGGYGGSGIGGGTYGSGSHITIEGSAEVTAKGGDSGSGIGGGRDSTGSEKITVSGNAQVKAQGGESLVNPNAPHAIGAGAAIGNGGAYQRDTVDPEPLKGQEVTPNIDDLNEGWIATYDPSITNLDTAIPDTLTYQDNGQLTTSSNAAPVGKQEPTCTEDGHEAGYKIGDVLVAVTIQHTGHNVPNGYTPQNDATCTTLGTMTGYCTSCQTDVTITDPNSSLKDHTFTTYTPDPGNLATCTKAGTKTAKCDHCDATHTIPDPIKDHRMCEA